MVGPDNPLEEHVVKPITYREVVKTLSEEDAKKHLENVRAAAEKALQMQQFGNGLLQVADVIKTFAPIPGL